MLMRLSSVCCAALLSSTLVAAHAPAAVFRGHGHTQSHHHPQPIRVQPSHSHHGYSHGYHHGHSQSHGRVWIAGTWVQRGCARVYVPGYWTSPPCPPAPCASGSDRGRVSVTWRW